MPARRSLLVLVTLGFLSLAACATPPETSQAASASAPAPDGPTVRIKRASLWVPELDEAITFYRDVIGLELTTVGELVPGQVLSELFNLPQGVPVRRALFSTPLEERVLFVMEGPDAPTYADGAPRGFVLVIQTADLDALRDRATAHGIPLGHSDALTSGDIRFEEQVVHGPDGQTVLVYQLDKPPA